MPDAAKIITEGFLQGAFSVFDAMLSKPFTHTPQEPAALTEGQLEELLGQHPVTLQAAIQNELGAVALLLSVQDAERFAAEISEAEPAGAEALSEQDKATLLEIAEPALGGGVTNLMERFGRNVEQLEGTRIADGGAEDAAQLAELLGDGAVAASFAFEAEPGFSGAGVFLYSRKLEELVPEEQLGKTEEETTLSEAEMSDILGDFGAAAGMDAPQAEAAVAPAPENLDMVLDIRLVVTARLGRVEMPIGDVLTLGPGSIVEIGHLVDDSIEPLVNDKLIARGDVVVVDEKFGFRITEIVSQQERIESLR